MTKILITRPAPFAAETATQLGALGHDCIVAPVLAARHVLPFPVVLTDNPILLVTSPQAAMALTAWTDLHHLRVMAVGARTADLLRDAGFAEVTSADSDARGLLNLIADTCETSQAFLLAVAPSTGQLLQQALQARGHIVTRLDVYEMMPVARLPAETVTALENDEISHVLLYSARSATAFLALVGDANLIANLPRVTALCLSEAVANAAGAATWRAIRVANAPTSAALHNLLSAIE